MSFTVHNITPELDKRLSEQARSSGMSKNRLVKEILAQAVGLPSVEEYSDDYREFCGIWNENDRKDFEKAQEENRKVDPEDWKRWHDRLYFCYCTDCRSQWMEKEYFHLNPIAPSSV